MGQYPKCNQVLHETQTVTQHVIQTTTHAGNITKASVIQGLCINCMEVKWTFIVACTIAGLKMNTILLVTNTKCSLKFTAITSLLKLQKPLHENITAETTWPTSWGYIQIYSLVWKFLYFDSYLTEIYFQWSIIKRSAVVQVMAWCQTDNKP